MANIKTTTEELTISGSIVPDTKQVLESSTNEEYWWETVKFLTNKIDELVEEVNALKNS